MAKQNLVSIAQKYGKGELTQLMKEIRQEGVLEGKVEAFKMVLTWLEQKYMDPDTRPDRNTPEAKAVLELAAEIAKLVREELEGANK